MTNETSKRSNSSLSRSRRWMMAGGVILTALIGLRHLMPGEASRGGSFDAFCPLGGIETLWAYISSGHTLKTTNLLNFTILLGVLGVSLLAGRAFCGWMCPLGTLQDIFADWARRLSGERYKPRGKQSQARFPMQVSPKIDHWLRRIKYLVLVAVLVVSMFAIFPPLRNICPARSFFAFHWNTSTLGIVLIIFLVSSMLIKRFSCKYLCPLGAALAIFNKISPLHLNVDADRCTSCGRCDAECPMDIPAVPENIRSAECIRCLECMETCAVADTVELRLG
jgi:polyferredoxin